MPPHARRAPLTAVVGSTVTQQVAFCGPLGVGKTTAVHAAASSAVSGSEVRSSLLGDGATAPAGAPAKRTTTVGIEYGEWHRTGVGPVAIYGTPGQSRFSEARSGALQGRPALVLWLFGQNDYALDEAREWLEYLSKEGWETLTVAVTRLDEPGDHPALEDYRPLLDSFDPTIRLLAADPRDAASVREVVRVALGEVAPPTGTRTAGTAQAAGGAR